jgi:Na+/proline symporter
MTLYYGLKIMDIAVIVAYFAAVMLIGFWASRKVKTDEDFLLGGRRFGKGLLVMHWLCTGTHSEMAVQVAGATARVGLGGIWYQWMWLFSTPFYWLIAPIIRRLRVMTTGDFFRIRYGRSTEMLYTLVAMIYLMVSIAMLLRGAGAAIAGATGGDVPTDVAVVLLSVLFSTYVVAGGLVAAAYTDYLQGLMIIALSVMLVPFGLSQIGGMSVVHETLGPAMLAVTAPPSAPEGHLGFVIAMSLLGLTGIVVQPHVMNATGSGRTETEARVGMCYGNFIKRLLTIAWAFTGLIAAVQFAGVLEGLDPGSAEARRASETLFGRAIRDWLGDGWRGLMIACLVAGVTSGETFMVVGSGLFTRNFYCHVVRGRDDRHYLWVSRLAAAGILALSIVLAFTAGSVTHLVLWSVQIIGLLGAPFWVGVVWRRANATAVWCSFLAGIGVWAMTAVDPIAVQNIWGLAHVAQAIQWLGELLNLQGHSRPVEIILGLVVQFGVMVLVSLLTRPHGDARLNPFFARLYTPVGREEEMRSTATDATPSEDAQLGLHGQPLDYHKATQFGYTALRRFGFELPRLTFTDCAGFLAAWVMVGGLIGLLLFLATLS